MNFVLAFMAVAALTLVGLAGGGSSGPRFVLTMIIPYAAIAVFAAGMIRRVWTWANAAVPFRVPTTSGQQKSLPWIRSARLDCPSSLAGVTGRMSLEVLFFRSLFRNNRAELRGGGKITFGEEKLLWLGALCFHWSLLIVVLRHLRIFLQPVPSWVLALQNADGFFEVGLPVLYVSDVVLLASLCYLLLRRLKDGPVRYLSLVSDYFALCLLGATAASGVLMRYYFPADLRPVKEYVLGLTTLSPRSPEGVSALFVAHLFLVCALLVYFPFSKLVHMGGVFLSPTRNLANDNRMKRHVNPWDYPVKVHTYAEWEAEFHDKIKAAGLPLEGQ